MRNHNIAGSGENMKLTMMMAITADGMIARNHAHFPDWTCSADKKMFKELTQKAGVVIFGSRTFETIGKPLDGRLNIVLTRHPERFQPAENLLFSSASPEHLLKDLDRRGFKEAVLAGGSIINTLFVKSRLINEVILTIAPQIFGQGVSLFSESCDLSLQLMEVQNLDAHFVVLRYRVIYA
jgi:dihydrofolate reductase